MSNIKAISCLRLSASSPAASHSASQHLNLVDEAAAAAQRRDGPRCFPSFTDKTVTLWQKQHRTTPRLTTNNPTSCVKAVTATFYRYFVKNSQNEATSAIDDVNSQRERAARSKSGGKFVTATPRGQKWKGVFLKHGFLKVSPHRFFKGDSRVPQQIENEFNFTLQAHAVKMILIREWLFQSLLSPFNC